MTDVKCKNCGNIWSIGHWCYGCPNAYDVNIECKKCNWTKNIAEVYPHSEAIKWYNALKQV